MEQGNSIPRRTCIDRHTPAELAIHNAIQEVEKLGADRRLTEAFILLVEAKNSVSDYVDWKHSETITESSHDQ